MIFWEGEIGACQKLPLIDIGSLRPRSLLLGNATYEGGACEKKRADKNWHVIILEGREDCRSIPRLITFVPMFGFLYLYPSANDAMQAFYKVSETPRFCVGHRYRGESVPALHALRLPGDVPLNLVRPVILHAEAQPHHRVRRGSVPVWMNVHAQERGEGGGRDIPRHFRSISLDKRFFP